VTNGVPFAEVTAFTHRGRVRAKNEDAIAVRRWVGTGSMSEPEWWRVDLEEPLLCLVADGMGGHDAGEVASRQAAGRMSEEAPNISGADAAAAALHAVNAEIFRAMERDAATRRMGTTICGLRLTRDRLVWFNVGDSRIYRVRNGFLRQISIDDVPVVAGAGQESETRRTHEILQALGGAPSFRPIDPHVGEDELALPSRWLLCSDGLTDMVDIDTMEQCLAASDREAVKALFARTMEAGGEDNVSIVIVSVAF
jgi:PPM family protein phosphatase